MEEFKSEYRVIAAGLRNANGGQSSRPIEIDRPWDAYADDLIGLMDHLGIRKFLVLGFSNADFMFTVTRDFVRNCQTPILVLPDDVPAHPYAVAMESVHLARNAQVSLYP